VIYLLMVPAMAAAIWAWRLAEANVNRLKRDALGLRIGVQIADQKADEFRDKLLKLSQEHQITVTDLLDTRAKLRESLDRCETISNHVDNAEGNLQIMKERLKKYEFDEQKRREQKRAGMQRYRANKKGAKK
jgi:hypothetical protein